VRGLPFEAAAFALILLGKSRFRICNEIWYWLGIVTLRTAATNVGDLLTHDLHMSFPAACALTAVALLAVIMVGQGYHAPAIPSSRGVPPTDGRYWLAMFLAGTLGTVGGDGLAWGLDLGVVIASALLCVVVSLLLSLRQMRRFETGALYWATILAIRTAGTTLGDVTAHDIGLQASTVCSGMLLLAVLVVWPAPSRAASSTQPV
jgi:uncharacterized membrane-anchored protein